MMKPGFKMTEGRAFPPLHRNALDCPHSVAAIGRDRVLPSSWFLFVRHFEYFGRALQGG